MKLNAPITDPEILARYFQVEGAEWSVAIHYVILGSIARDAEHPNCAAWVIDSDGKTRGNPPHEAVIAWHCAALGIPTPWSKLDLIPSKRTAAEEEQRRSFVYGNCRIANKHVTRELVDEVADKMALDIPTHHALVAGRAEEGSGYMNAIEELQNRALRAEHDRSVAELRLREMKDMAYSRMTMVVVSMFGNVLLVTILAIVGLAAVAVEEELRNQVEEAEARELEAARACVQERIEE